MVFPFIVGFPKVIEILNVKFQSDCLNYENFMDLKMNDTFILLGLP